MTKARLMHGASRLARFGREDDGAVAIWFSILLVPMLGMTMAAVKYSEYAGHRSGMIDAMDAAGLGLARQFEFDDLEACELADGAEGVDDPEEVTGKERARLERYARGFFEENYPEYDQLYGDKKLSKPFDLEKDMTFTLTCAYIRVEADAYADMGGVLGGYFGVGALPVKLETEISLPGAGRVELALVLDVTGSMCFPDTVGVYNYPGDCADAPDRRIDKLRAAVDTMLNDPNFYGPKDDGSNEFVRMSIVPFNMFTNVDADYEGRSYNSSVYDEVGDWMDGWNGTSPQAYFHGFNFFHATASGTVSGKTPNGTIVASPNSAVSNTTKVNHFTLFDSVSSDGAAWKGCVEARPFPLDEVAVPVGHEMTDTEYDAVFEVPSSVSGAVSLDDGLMEDAWEDFDDRKPSDWNPKSAVNTLFVPYFGPDEPDCVVTCEYEVDVTEDAIKNAPYRAFMNDDGWSNDPIFPGHLFDAVVSDGDDQWVSNNSYFVYDAHYTRPGYATNDDLNRYKNLVLRARATINSCDNGGYSNANDATVKGIRKKTGYEACGTEEYRFRHAYAGAYDAGSARYVGKYDKAYDNHDGGANLSSSDDVTWKGPNAGCPGPILPLTTEKSDLTARMDALKPSGGTNTSIGLIWGWRTLTHEAPFVQASDPSEPGEGRWKKYVVLMSDGNNSLNSYPDSFLKGAYGPFGYPGQDRWGVVDGNDAAADYQEEIDLKTIRICHRMRQEGIKVFTIGFAIKEDSRADKMLAACAVDKDAYKLATDGDDLADKFKDITEQIVELHVSG